MIHNHMDTLQYIHIYVHSCKQIHTLTTTNVGKSDIMMLALQYSYKS